MFNFIFIIVVTNILFYSFINVKCFIFFNLFEFLFLNTTKVWSVKTENNLFT